MTHNTQINANIFQIIIRVHPCHLRHSRSFHHFHQETHRTKTIVARHHSRMGIFHPAVVQVARPMGQRHDERRKALPRTFAQPIGLHPPLRHKHLPLLQVARMFYRIFVLLHQVVVAHLPHHGDFNFLHVSNKLAWQR